MFSFNLLSEKYAVMLLVALISPVVPLAAVPTPSDASCVLVLVACAVIVILADPLKLTPLIATYYNFDGLYTVVCDVFKRLANDTPWFI
jgi:hypothetical protein